MIRDCNLIVLIALVIIGAFMPIKRIEPSAASVASIPGAAGGANSAGLFPDPPTGHPFPRMDKAVLLQQYLDVTHSWGWTDAYALAFAGYALNLQGYDWRMGPGPILQAIP